MVRNAFAWVVNLSLFLIMFLQYQGVNPLFQVRLSKPELANLLRKRLTPTSYESAVSLKCYLKIQGRDFSYVAESTNKMDRRNLFGKRKVMLGM